MTTPTPQSIDVLLESRVLELGYADGTVLALPFEFLRVYSPSAEVMGHGPGQETLQTGKRGVEIVDLQTVGHYAIQPTFSDGHQSGIFTWDYLYRLGTQKMRCGRNTWTAWPPPAKTVTSPCRASKAATVVAAAAVVAIKI